LHPERRHELAFRPPKSPKAKSVRPDPLPATSDWLEDYILCITNFVDERIVSTSEFKAKCLAFLDEIEQFGKPITTTRRGRPVAVLGPAGRDILKSPRNSWARKGRIIGDIVNNDRSALWEAVRTK
jgi:antitoxin (DNA-binding transcriptional repressor) of toxin-antitoxin stability system